MKTKPSAKSKQSVKSVAKAPAKAPEKQPATVSAFSTTIADFGAARQRMDFNLGLIADLSGGTQTMRKAGRRWLPQEPGEEDSRYLVRLNRSTFFNGYANVIRSLIGRPFSKPIKPSDKLPPAFLPYLNDIDRAGHSLQVWARDVFAAGVRDGQTHWICEYPDSSSVSNAAEEEGMRPYFVQIDARQVL